ncbi:MAG: rhodanese-like domain-containing protein [Candidatus Acidiferrales bacterium]
MKTSFVLVAGTAMLALAATAPVARAQQQDLSAVDPTVANEAQPAPQTVAPEAVLKMVQTKDSSIALVDTQPVDGYADGHLPGATSYPWAMRITKFPIPLPRNKTLVLYGSCPNDTSDMIKQLAEFGYFNIKVMDGGWYKWVALKYPAEGKGGYAQSHPVTLGSVPQQPVSQSATQQTVAQNK